MTRLNQLAIFCAAAVLTFLANVSGAAPLSLGSGAIIEANATQNVIERVHGTHRACVRGWVPRWAVVRWHRHVGVTNLPIRC
jgi:hypothetical protein